MYSSLTGRDASNVDYYRAFQYWRLAAIVWGVMARYLKGVMGGKADTNAFRVQIDGLARPCSRLKSNSALCCVPSTSPSVNSRQVPVQRCWVFQPYLYEACPPRKRRGFEIDPTAVSYSPSGFDVAQLTRRTSG